MKRLLLSGIFACLLAAPNAGAQNVAVGLHAGFAAYINGNTSMGVPVGLHAEWAYDARHAFSGTAHYSIGVQSHYADFFYVSTAYKYHLVGESLDGFYLGGYLGFGGGSGSGYLSVGGVTGWSKPIGERFNFEANVEMGYGIFNRANTHVFHLVPTVGFRYTF